MNSARILLPALLVLGIASTAVSLLSWEPSQQPSISKPSRDGALTVRDARSRFPAEGPA